MLIPRRGFLAIVAAFLVALIPPSPIVARAQATDGVVQVDPGSLRSSQVVAFDAMPLGNYDDVIQLRGAAFAERFAGQSVSPRCCGSSISMYEQATGTPLGPIRLQVGVPGENLSIIGDGPDHRLVGNGHNTFAPPGTIVRGGVIAILFDANQAEIAFDILGTPTGPADLHFAFFARDASRIGDVTISDNPRAGTYAFRTRDGKLDIAGVEIEHSLLTLTLDSVRFTLLPTATEDCTDGSYVRFTDPTTNDPFRNQGQCVQFLRTGK